MYKNVISVAVHPSFSYFSYTTEVSTSGIDRVQTET